VLRRLQLLFNIKIENILYIFIYIKEKRYPEKGSFKDIFKNRCTVYNSIKQFIIQFIAR